MKNELNEKTLPVNRKHLFVNLVKNEKHNIMLLSLCLFIFIIPLFIVVFVFITELSGILTEYSSAEDELKNTYFLELISLKQSMHLFSIPCIVFFGVGASGCCFFSKKLIWNEHRTFFKDFKEGVRKNVGQFLVVSLLFAMFMFSLNYCFSYFSIQLSDSIYVIYLQIIQVILIIISAIMLVFQYSEITVYKANLLTIIKNSMILTFGSILSSTFFLIICALPIMLLLFLKSVVFYIACISLLSLFIFGLIILILTLHSHSVFDKYINKRKYPEIYRKGLYDMDQKGLEFDEKTYNFNKFKKE